MFGLLTKRPYLCSDYITENIGYGYQYKRLKQRDEN